MFLYCILFSLCQCYFVHYLFILLSILMNLFFLTTFYFFKKYLNLHFKSEYKRHIKKVY